MVQLHIEELASWDMPVLHLRNLQDVLAYVKHYPDAVLQVRSPVGVGVFMSEAQYNDLEKALMGDKVGLYATPSLKSQRKASKKTPSRGFPYWEVDILAQVVSAVEESQQDVRRIIDKKGHTGVAMSSGVYKSLSKANLVEDQGDVEFK